MTKEDYIYIGGTVILPTHGRTEYQSHYLTGKTLDQIQIEFTDESVDWHLDSGTGKIFFVSPNNPTKAKINVEHEPLAKRL